MTQLALVNFTGNLENKSVISFIIEEAKHCRFFKRDIKSIMNVCYKFILL